jgi:hypothetical protein
MVFLRSFYDEKGRVSTKNWWVWVVHALNYPYIIYVYISCEMGDTEGLSQARRMWIPLDVILTFLIVCYQAWYRFMEILNDHDQAALEASKEGDEFVDD